MDPLTLVWVRFASAGLAVGAWLGPLPALDGILGGSALTSLVGRRRIIGV